MSEKIKAYAIFAGGGVKGAAFAGCLKAAEEFGFEFVGYAGASAGSIAAALACAGYNADELKTLLAETDYRTFFEDNGEGLSDLLDSAFGFDASVLSFLSLPLDYARNRSTLGTIKKFFGLYEGKNLNDFIRNKLTEKVRSGRSERTRNSKNKEISFAELEKEVGKPLKVIVSDIVKNKPVVFSSEDEKDVSVTDAVRASSSFPFVFKPTKIGKRELLVDGGLSCNLPFFVFEKERQKNHLPVIAFNLVPETTAKPPYNLMDFCSDMINTALESSEALLHQFIHGLYIVPVKTNVGTFEIKLSKEKQELLYLSGYKSSMSYFNENLKEWQQADTNRKQLQALYAPSYIVEPVLASMAKEFEEKTPCREVRVSVSLPNRWEKRILAYHHGFRSDDFELEPDFELNLEAGSGGEAWKKGVPSFADLEYARANPKNFGITELQARKIRDDRKAIMSVSIFHLKRDAGRMAELEPFGVLSIDTNTPFLETGWLEEDSCRRAIDLMIKWADVISYILKGSL